MIPVPLTPRCTALVGSRPLFEREPHLEVGRMLVRAKFSFLLLIPAVITRQSVAAIEALPATSRAKGGDWITRQ